MPTNSTLSSWIVASWTVWNLSLASRFVPNFGMSDGDGDDDDGDDDDDNNNVSADTGAITDGAYLSVDDFSGETLEISVFQSVVD